MADRFEFVEGVFDDGFGPDRSLEVTHVRSICFIKPNAFLVVDRLLGDGEHDLSWHFMFYPRSMRVDRAGCAAVSAETDGPNVRLTWSDEALSPELVVGEIESPFRGLMTADQDRACPSLFLERRAALPLCVVYLVEPVGPGSRPTLTLDDPVVQEAVEFARSNTGVPFQDERSPL